MINPWQCNYDGLVSLSSGSMASDDVATDLLAAKATGTQKLQEFIDTRVKENSDDIFATLKQLKLKTFSQAPARSKAKTTQKQVKSERSMFARMIVVAKSRSIDMKEVLSYSLSSVPACLSSADLNGLSKTNKAALLHTLEKEEFLMNDEQLKQMLQSAVMVDAMAILQAISVSQLPSTFGALAELVLQKLITMAKKFKATRVDFVGDQYNDVSIKNVERVRRTNQSQDITIYGPDQKLPKQWKKFMSGANNKARLQIFITEQWETILLGVNIDIYVAVAETCTQLKWRVAHEKPEAVVIHDLRSNHEEADTRLILHANHAAQTGIYDHVIISSPDTDVAVLSITHVNSMCQTKVLFATGVGNKRRILDLTALSTSLGEQLSNALTGFHAFTGCDSISSFAGKGKRTCYKALLSNETFLEMFSSLGSSQDVSDQLMDSIQRFVCALYGSKSADVNTARYTLFCTSAPIEKSLPPNKDALTQHLKRANYQSFIWRQCLKPIMVLNPPQDHGWIMEDSLNVKWLTGPAAPPDVIKLKNCACKGGCDGARCSCFRSGLSCTELCTCVQCRNSTTGTDSDLDGDFDSDSDSED